MLFQNWEEINISEGAELSNDLDFGNFVDFFVFLS